MAARGVAAANRIFYEDEVSVVIGGTCSIVCFAVMDLAEEAQIPWVTATCTNTQITEQTGIGGNEWFFRVQPYDAAFGRVGGKILVEEFGYETFSGLVRDDDFGRGVLNDFETAIVEAGGEVISKDYFKAADRDFTAILTRIEALNPDAMIVTGMPDEAFRILGQYHELGMSIPVNGRVNFYAEEITKELGMEYCEGFTSVEPWFVQDAKPASQEFLRRFIESEGYEPIWQAVTPYVAMLTVAEAIELAGSDDPAAAGPCL